MTDSSTGHGFSQTRFFSQFWIWAMICLISGIGFFLVAGGFDKGSPVEKLDTAIFDWTHSQRCESITRTALYLTFFGSGLFLTGGFVVVAILLALKRLYYWLIFSSVTFFGGFIGVPLLKAIFHRPRPIFDDPIVHLSGYSFPSGHVMGSTLFCGAMVIFVLNSGFTIRNKIVSVVCCVLYILTIACTRIYLGVHYFSDTVAGFAGGVSWLCFCMGILRILWNRVQLGISPGGCEKSPLDLQ